MAGRVDGSVLDSVVGNGQRWDQTRFLRLRVHSGPGTCPNSPPLHRNSPVVLAPESAACFVTWAPDSALGISPARDAAPVTAAGPGSEAAWGPRRLGDGRREEGWAGARIQPSQPPSITAAPGRSDCPPAPREPRRSGLSFPAAIDALFPSLTDPHAALQP